MREPSLVGRSEFRPVDTIRPVENFVDEKDRFFAPAMANHRQGCLSILLIFPKAMFLSWLTLICRPRGATSCKSALSSQNLRFAHNRIARRPHRQRLAPLSAPGLRHALLTKNRDEPHGVAASTQALIEKEQTVHPLSRVRVTAESSWHFPTIQPQRTQAPGFQVRKFGRYFSHSDFGLRISHSVFTRVL